jgi:hypothetical protein
MWKKNSSLKTGWNNDLQSMSLISFKIGVVKLFKNP